MATRLYLGFHGTQTWVLQATSLADARTQVLEKLNGAIKGLIPLNADEIRVRPAREDEIADLLASV